MDGSISEHERCELAGERSTDTKTKKCGMDRKKFYLWRMKLSLFDLNVTGWMIILCCHYLSPRYFPCYTYTSATFLASRNKFLRGLPEFRHQRVFSCKFCTTLPSFTRSHSLLKTGVPIIIFPIPALLWKYI